jgi:hypothetical protein
MHPQIAAFPRLGRENTPPVRTLEGQKTLISRTMHGFAYGEPRDEIVVMSALAQAVLVFRGGATGEEPPIRVIQGPKTQIQGTPYGANSQVVIDTMNNEIYVPVVPDGILVFNMTDNGDVAPKRVIKGITGALAVDPIHNVLIVNTARALNIFDRTASGDSPKPKNVITGPRTTLRRLDTIQVTSKGWIVAGAGDAATGHGIVGAWSINDNGDVPPHWEIPAQQLTGYDPYSVAIDSNHKEMILAAAGGNRRLRPTRGAMNAVVAFSWPEIF